MVIVDLKNLPLIQSYDSIQSLTKDINKSDREHDLVIAVSVILLFYYSIQALNFFHFQNRTDSNMLLLGAMSPISHQNFFMWPCFVLISARSFLLLVEVLCAWRDTIPAGQNYHCATALESYTRCSGKLLSHRYFMSPYVHTYRLMVHVILLHY